MESEIDFAPLLLVSALAFLIPLGTHRLTGGKVPPVVGEILAGILFGSTVAGVIEPNVWLDFLSLFGFAYLMFLAGLEVDTALLVRPLGPRWYRPGVALRHPLLAGVLLVGLFVGAAGGGVVAMHSWDLVDDLELLFFVLAATAVGVLAPVLKGREELGPYAQVLLVTGFFVEFVAIVAIGIIAAIDRDGLGLEALLLLALPAAFLFLLALARTGRTRVLGLEALMTELAHASSQIKIRGALALLVVFVVLSQVVGTELVLGAFFAGLALTLISPRQGSSMRVKLDALGYGFFIPIFFITTGATLDLDALGESADAALLIPAFLALALLGKLLSSLLVLWPAFGLRRAVAGGVLFSANLNIILAAVTVAEESGRLDEAEQAALLVVALVSTALAPLGFNALMPRVGRDVIGSALVVGAGRTGADLTARLTRAGLAVSIIDSDEAALQPLRQLGCRAIVGDARDRGVLAQAQPQAAEVAVITVEDRELTYAVAQRLREAARELRIVTWVRDEDPRLAPLDVEMHTLGATTAVALEGAVLRPGLFQALGSGGDSGLEEVTVRNPEAVDMPLYTLPLPGGARVILIMRGGTLLIPEGETELQILDRVTLGGEPAAVRESFDLLSGQHIAPRRPAPLAADGEPVVTEAESAASGAESPEF